MVDMRRTKRHGVAWAVGLGLAVLPDVATSQQAPTEDDVAAELEALESEVDAPPEVEPTDEEVTARAPATDPALVRPTGGGVATVQTMNPDIAVILTTAAAYHSDEPDLSGGHDPQSFGFNLQGLELSVGGAVDPYFAFDSAILLSQFGVEVEEAYAETLALPAGLQARAGQFKAPFGRHNPTHLHSWHFVTQPLVVGKFFGGESLRGLGAEASWLVPLPWFAEATLAVQNVAGEATGRSFQPSPDAIDDPLDLTAIARLEQFFALSVDWSLLAGVSWAAGRNGTGRDNISEVYGADVFVKWKSSTTGGSQEVGWQTEAMLRRRQVPLDVLQDVGGYSYVYYKPSLFWEFGARHEAVTGVEPRQVDGLQLVDARDPDWTETRQRGSLAVGYLPSHFSKLRLEYELDYLPYRAGELDEIVHQVFLQLELVAGAHGAHEF